MEMSFEPARVRVNESEAREARLVRLDGAIVAVLSRVRPDEVEGESLEWHLEAGFGPCFSPAGRVSRAWTKPRAGSRSASMTSRLSAAIEWLATERMRGRRACVYVLACVMFL
jgi:hypothetical protein